VSIGQHFALPFLSSFSSSSFVDLPFLSSSSSSSSSSSFIDSGTLSVLFVVDLFFVF